MEDFVDINIRQKDTFFKNANEDKERLLSFNRGIENHVFEYSLLWTRILAEFKLLATLIEIPEIVELSEIDYKLEEKEIDDLTDIFEEFDYFDHKRVGDLAVLVVNKYSCIDEAIKNILPLLENFSIIEKQMNYLWSLQTADSQDFSFLSMASSFQSLMYHSVYSLIDTMCFLSNICESPCYVYCEKKKQYVSEQSRVIVCLQEIMYSLDLLKALHCHKMKRLSIFLALEKIYPSVDWIEVENVFVGGYGFSSGGDLTYEMYVKGLVDVYHNLNTTFANFWRGFFPGYEDLKKGAVQILEWLEKSEFYYGSEGKLFEGIITQHIAFTYSLVSGSAHYALLKSYSFFKDMSIFIQSELNLLIVGESYKIDECKLMFAADAKHICNTRYSTVDIFGKDDAATPPRGE